MAPVPVATAHHHLNNPYLISGLFGLGLVGYLLSWILLAYAGEDFLVASIAPGPLLAAVHAMTGLGILPVTIAACFQMLPVLSRSKPPNTVLSWLVFALVAGGQSTMIISFSLYDMESLGFGVSASGLGTLLFVFLMIPVLRKGNFDHFPDTRIAASLAMAFLVMGLTMGVSMGLNYSFPWLARPDLAAIIHAVLMTFGYIGFLVLGFSPFLIQMIALAKAPKKREGHLVNGLAALSLAFICTGIAVEMLYLVAIGFLVAFAAAALHIRLMEELLHAGMSKRAKHSILLLRISWIFLMATLLASFAGMAGWIDDRWLSLALILVFQGWLFSLVIAVAGKIFPFLAAMYTVRFCRSPAVVTHLEPQHILKYQAVLHGLALSLAVLAAFIDSLPVLYGAGLTGTLSAGMLIYYAAMVLVRTLRHRKAVGTKPDSRTA